MMPDDGTEGKRMRVENLCIYCMYEKHSPYEVCPRCGQRNETYRPRMEHLPPGTLLNGQYYLGRCIGHGGFGILYIAIDRALQIVVAIKELFPSGYVARDANGYLHPVGGSDSAQILHASRSKFIQEARTLAQMRAVLERGIVQVYGFFEQFGTAYMVMEYLDGINLKEYVNKNEKISTAQMLEMMKPVVLSLEQLHEQKIIHRDISPDNLMVLKRSGVKLLDFGAVKDVYSHTKTSVSFVKEGYSPIEQFTASGNVGPWTDVYALCATMYFCITGTRIPKADDRISKELRPPSAMGAKISKHVEKILLKGLALRPEDRLRDMRQLYDGLYAKRARPSFLDILWKGTVGVSLAGVFAALIFVAYAYLDIGGDRPKNEAQNTPSEQEQTQPAVVILDREDNAGTGNEGLSLARVGQAGTQAEAGAGAAEDGAGQEAAGVGATDAQQSGTEVEEGETEIPLQVARVEGPGTDFFDYAILPVSAANASSTISQEGISNDATLLFDGRGDTSWQEGIQDGFGIGETVSFRFDRAYAVKYMSFQLGNWKSEEYFAGNAKPKKLTVYIGDFAGQVEFSEEKTVQWVAFSQDVSGDSMRLQIDDIYPGTKWEDTCISEVTVYGR